MRTLSQVLRDTTERFPQRSAILDPSGITLTYEELSAKVNQLARGMVELGIAKGDRVGLWMPNIPEWVVSISPSPESERYSYR